THVFRADENLRGRAVPVRPLDHFGPSLTIAGHVDLGESGALAVEKLLGPFAIGAIRPRVNNDVRHGEPLLKDRLRGPHYMGSPRPSTTRANTRTSTAAAPARNRARAQASMVAPEVRTSSTSTSRRSLTSARASARTRNAPWTLRERSDAVRPTCCRVAFT